MVPINSRNDLDALKGTADYAQALAALLGASVRWDWVNDQWQQVEDYSRIESLGFTKQEFLAECASKDVTVTPSPPPDPPGPTIPQSVSPLQARRALRANSLKAAVDAALAQAGEEAQETWDYAIEIRRDDPLLLQLAATLDLTDEQLDVLFVQAADM